MPYITLIREQVDRVRDYPRLHLLTLLKELTKLLEEHRAAPCLECIMGGLRTCHLHLVELADVVLTRLEEMWEADLGPTRERLTTDWRNFFPREWAS